MQRKLVILTYSERGAEMVKELLCRLREEDFSCQGYLFEKYEAEGLVPFAKTDELIQECFVQRCGLLFVCATGIAVRAISPFIRSKETDPAVLVMDELGRFVIPILSGHLGGANALARLCARVMGGVAVITTATDVQQQFSVDDFARKCDMAIDDLSKAKKISVELLAGHTVEICVRWLTEFHHGEALLGDKQLPFVEKFSGRNAGILISPFCEEILDSKDIIQLIPRRFILGIGCRRGVEADALQSVVWEALKQCRLDERSFMKITTIDRKGDEEAILSLAQEWGLPLETFSAEELAAQEGTFTGSEFVREVTGVDNVCERSVWAGGSDKILLPKYAREGVTVSVGVCGYQKKVVLFGGTTEGRRLVEYLEQARIPSVVCVATEYGKRVLGEELSYCDVVVARMDAQQMERFLRDANARLVIDATHPYAAEVTENISKACSCLDMELYRVVRESVPYSGQAICVDSAAEAACYLAEQNGKILITTGSKELKYFQDFPNASERLFARILPSEPSVQMAEACGFGREQLILGTGPFSVGENVGQLEQVHAKYLLTKDTGREGGFPEKLKAAEQTGVIPVVIRRPAVEDGVSVEEMISLLEEASIVKDIVFTGSKEDSYD